MIASDDDIISRLVVKARQQFEIRAWQMPEAELPADLLPVADPVFWWHEEGTKDSLVPLEAQPTDLGDGFSGYEDGAAYSMSRDISEQPWWICEHDRERRKQASRSRR